MTSRSEMMPTTRVPSTTGKAPMRRSPSSSTTARTGASAPMVATSLPLDDRIAAMVMAASKLSRTPALLLASRAAKGNHAQPGQRAQTRSAPEPATFDARAVHADHEMDGPGVDPRRRHCGAAGGKRRQRHSPAHDDRHRARRGADRLARRGADDASLPKL